MQSVNQLPELSLVMPPLLLDTGELALSFLEVLRAQRIRWNKPTWQRPYGSWKVLTKDLHNCIQIDLTIKEHFLNHVQIHLEPQFGELPIVNRSKLTGSLLTALQQFHAWETKNVILHPLHATLVMMPLQLNSRTLIQPHHVTLLTSNMDTDNGKKVLQSHALTQPLLPAWQVTQTAWNKMDHGYQELHTPTQINQDLEPSEKLLEQMSQRIKFNAWLTIWLPLDKAQITAGHSGLREQLLKLVLTSLEKLSSKTNSFGWPMRVWLVELTPTVLLWKDGPIARSTVRFHATLPNRQDWTSLQKVNLFASQLLPSKPEIERARLR